jgi:hypothetical protein
MARRLYVSKQGLVSLNPLDLFEVDQRVFANAENIAPVQNWRQFVCPQAEHESGDMPAAIWSGDSDSSD